jgi:NADH-quinone oxidoreductase subunit N
LGVVQAVLGVGMNWLAVVAVLFTVSGAYYYLRIVKLMYFDEPTDADVLGGSMLMRTVLSCNALLVLGLGIIPGTLLQLCQRALQ